MCKFVLQARQQNVDHYSPKTLFQLSSNLHSWALAQNLNTCRFLDKKDPSFQPFHNFFNNTSKKLLAIGVRAVKNKQKSLNLIKMFKGVIGTHTPISLHNILSRELTNMFTHVKVSEVISKPTTMMACEQSQTNSQTIPSHSYADKENVFNSKDLHGCTININFNKKLMSGWTFFLWKSVSL